MKQAGIPFKSRPFAFLLRLRFGIRPCFHPGLFGTFQFRYPDGAGCIACNVQRCPPHIKELIYARNDGNAFHRNADGC